MSSQIVLLGLDSSHIFCTLFNTEGSRMAKGWWKNCYSSYNPLLLRLEFKKFSLLLWLVKVFFVYLSICPHYLLPSHNCQSKLLSTCLWGRGKASWSLGTSLNLVTRCLSKPYWLTNLIISIMFVCLFVSAEYIFHHPDETKIWVVWSSFNLCRPSSSRISASTLRCHPALNLNLIIDSHHHLEYLAACPDQQSS